MPPESSTSPYGVVEPTEPGPRSHPIDPITFANELKVLLAPFLTAQDWYSPVPDPELWVRSVDTLADGWPTLLWVMVEVQPRANGSDVQGSAPMDRYQFLLGATETDPVELPADARLGSMATPRGRAWLFDALADEELAIEVAGLVAPDIEVSTIRALPGERLNTSLVVNETHLVKVFRRVPVGPNPDVEITEALGRVGYGGAPVPVATWRRDSDDLAVLRRFERARGDGWDLALASLTEVFEQRRAPRECELDFAAGARQLGAEIARLHVALAEAFGALPADGSALVADMLAQVRRVSAGRVDTGRIEKAYRRMESAEDLGAMIRIHGSLHLGHVLRMQRSWMVFDFEGEPGRPVQERRRPSSPLRDVAGMTRSFHQAAATALEQFAQRDDSTSPDKEVRVLADSWFERNVNSFLSGYADVDAVHRLLPGTRAGRDALLNVFELDNAVYEVAHDLALRPGPGELPARAIERLLSDTEGA